MDLPIVLASSSPSRLKLLKQIGIIPDAILPADIDESQRRGELPADLARRLCFEKAAFVANSFSDAIIIGADTVSAAGRLILHKSTDAEDVRKSLKILSGRRHHVYTGVCVIRQVKSETTKSIKVVKSIVKFKTLSNAEIELYCQSGQGIGKAGGCSISGYAESFVTYMSGSFSNIIGLPLYETHNMLKAKGVTNFDIMSNRDSGPE